MKTSPVVTIILACRYVRSLLKWIFRLMSVPPTLTREFKIGNPPTKVLGAFTGNLGALYV